MGIVVRATHLQLGEAVALKFLHGHVAQDADHVQRFLREARAAVRIKSEHVARVMDVGTLPSGAPFIVMELLVGEDLHRVTCQRGPLPVAEAVEYVLQACRAIAEAHQLGIVHRDLKPANLFLTRRADGTPLIKVLDFGISKSMEGSDQSLTATGDALGSPPYMAPEQIRDARLVDGRTDIWALGSVLYTLLAGRPAFLAPNSAGTLAKIMADPVPSLRDARPDVPAQLEAIVLSCLEKSPEQRLQRVEQLAAALSSVRRLAGATSPETGASAEALAPGSGPTLLSLHGDTTATSSSVTGRSRAPRSALLPALLGALLTVVIGGGLVLALRAESRPAADGAATAGAGSAAAPAPSSTLPSTPAPSALPSSGPAQGPSPSSTPALPSASAARSRPPAPAGREPRRAAPPARVHSVAPVPTYGQD
jgi:serine/threonine protein kinase